MKLVEFASTCGERLFDLPPDQRGGYAQAFSKRWNPWVRSLGVVDRRVSFHSFRHHVTQTLKDAEVPLVTIRALLGWSSPGMEAVYGGQFAVATLQNAVEVLPPIPRGPHPG